MRRTLTLTLVLLAISANALADRQGRIAGKITEVATKKAVPNAVVTVMATEGRNFKQDYKTKADGSYAILLIDATLKYEFTYSAPGYNSYREIMKLKLGEPNNKDVELAPANGGASGTVSTVPAAEIKIDPAIAAFNEGAQLANDGKNAEALAKFQEAVAARPDLVRGWEAMAKLELRAKNYAKSITAALKANELSSDDPDMNTVLFEAYTASGDKAKAAEYRSKMPANAAALFNDAARLINSGKDREAETFLKQAVAADEKFAPAFYELGMLYVRSGKNADARANLQKYLALEPNGKEAATAKEMLNYVK